MAPRRSCSNSEDLSLHLAINNRADSGARHSFLAEFRMHRLQNHLKYAWKFRH